MMDDYSISRLPEPMQDSADKYLAYGDPPGDFMRAVLENDLVNAYGHADLSNRDAMHDWVLWLYNDIPSKCWGSSERVDAWIEQGGVYGDDEPDE